MNSLQSPAWTGAALASHPGTLACTPQALPYLASSVQDWVIRWPIEAMCAR
jgi:hypothetical protein